MSAHFFSTFFQFCWNSKFSPKISMGAGTLRFGRSFADSVLHVSGGGVFWASVDHIDISFVGIAIEKHGACSCSVG